MNVTFPNDWRIRVAHIKTSVKTIIPSCAENPWRKRCGSWKNLIKEKSWGARLAEKSCGEKKNIQAACDLCNIHHSMFGQEIK